ncbi:putative tail fiber protein (GpH) [Escherichia coli M056]|uniref:phage tail protein n=1 Tax=Escherichia coli TaxID=562 RepID=UPI000A184F4F|nr:phage tail protein [Escherichia coli]OSK25412.1 putative tail fiber protein (GpH) [Escherichia coli M056]
MHRIDTATAQVDKFGPGKNGFTNGDPSTGRRATDLNSDMWDAVQEEICRVIEGAGITLDKQTHEQLYLAVMALAGNAVSAAALLKKNNLSDVEDKAKATEHLGLSPTIQKAANAVQRSGDKMTGELKIGTANALRIFDKDFGLIFRRSEDFLHFIPTAKGQGENGDIGSLRPFAINLKTGAISASHGVNIDGGLALGTDNALGGNSIVLGDNDTGLKQNGDGVLDVYANGVHVFRFQNGVAVALAGIQAGDGKKITLSSGNTSAYHAGLNLWGNGGSRPTVVELGDDAGYHWYSQRNPDGSIVFNVNGQVQPGNWDNIDSRYVKDIRLGSQRVDGHYDDDFCVPAGYVVVGGDVSGSTALKLYSRPVQKLTGGTWYTVSVV